MSASMVPPVPPGCTVIYRRWRRDPRTGAWLDARRYGHRAWRMVVRKGDDKAE